MDLNKLEQDINAIVSDLNKDQFIYQFLLAYDFPKATITRLQKGSLNRSKNKDAVNQEILWKSLFFRVEQQQDLHLTIDESQKDPVILKQHPRFIIVTNFKILLAVDTKTGDSLDISLTELSNNHTFFLPWAGMEKTQIQSLNLADIKAAEKLAQLYDIIIQENQIETESERHGLNIFLSRLLFCFFAEDTGIFEDNQFTNAVASHTHKDGSDCQSYLIALFNVLNVEKRSHEPTHLKAFPYVNGGLFSTNYPAPKLNAKARKMIIDSGALNWKQINPDIFGSMMQAVVHSDQRGSLGMHYTSVANIMKVIEPLFLNDLKEQMERAGNNENKLIKLLDRLYHLRLFDPACGSGNFLIIAYKELCKCEIDIFKKLQEINPTKWRLADGMAISGIQLTQFYGIELDDFAHETAKLSLWLAEHQMNLAFKAVFGSAKPTLPLQEGGHIVCGNSMRVDWEVVCPKEDGVEVYIMGNPPYLGARMQNKEQKEDLQLVFNGIKGYKNLDYVACWFMKGVNFINNSIAELAFVSTNSICQGEQVALLWPHVLSLDVNIGFAHQSFKWANNAKGNAGVTCVVVGLSGEERKEKIIFKDSISKSVKTINTYLISGSSNIFVKKRSRPLSNLPLMPKGNMPYDGGNFSLTTVEKNQLISDYPEAEAFIKRLIGAREFIQGIERWCIWMPDKADTALLIPFIKKRIKGVEKMRLSSTDASANKLADRPHQFREINEPTSNSIIVPSVTSERREYIPIGFLDDKTIG